MSQCCRIGDMEKREKNDLKDKKVTVMGLGLHGGAVGTIKWLHEQGAKLKVTDMKTEEELAPSLEKLKDIMDVHYHLGGHKEGDFKDADLVIRNPAVPRKSKFIEIARQNGIPIEMDSSLFFKIAKPLKIIGVTGSKGKTTTATAIAELLKPKYAQAVLVGNDGVSPLAEVGSVREDEPVVFELSSWRLEALDEYELSPEVAVVTSLYRDHLNTYDSYDHYIETKKTIIKHQGKDDLAILNADDKLVVKWQEDVKGNLLWYSTGSLNSQEGIGIEDGIIKINLEGRETIEIISVDSLPVKSEHEIRNLLPGILLAHLHEVRSEEIIEVLKRFKTLPHRLESVRVIDGVEFINDSAATMPDATIAALRSLEQKPIVHILGGSDKALEYEELALQEVKRNIKALVFLPGTVTDNMKQIISAAFANPPSIIDAENMKQAVDKAFEVASDGDTVLMSPAATSFGLFKHEFDRGDKFRKAVLAL